MKRMQAFKHALRGYAWNQYKIRDLQDEIAEREHELTGLARRGVDMTPEQLRSGKPMPAFQPGSGPSITAKIYELDKVKERLKWQESQFAVLDRMPETDKEMVLDLYAWGMPAEAVAEKYGYSRRGVYYHADSVIRRAMIEK